MELKTKTTRELMMDAMRPKAPQAPQMLLDDILAGIADCTTDAGHVITSCRYRYQMLMRELEKHNPNR